MSHGATTPEQLRRLAYRFAVAVPPGTTQTLRQAVPADGTVERLRVRIYAGAGLALRIRPYVENARLQRRDLLTYPAGGKAFVDGDDDVFDWMIREPVHVEPQDEIVVEFTNTDGANTYDAACDIEVDFAGGPWPVEVVAVNA